jgi:hypothetical protein
MHQTHVSLTSGSITDKPVNLNRLFYTWDLVFTVVCGTKVICKISSSFLVHNKCSIKVSSHSFPGLPVIDSTWAGSIRVGHLSQNDHHVFHVPWWSPALMSPHCPPGLLNPKLTCHCHQFFLMCVIMQQSLWPQLCSFWFHLATVNHGPKTLRRKFH